MSEAIKPPYFNALLTVLDDNKAVEVRVMDVSQQTSVTDYMVICSGRSSRHVKATAEHVLESLKKHGVPCLGHHGLDSGTWALLDFGDVIVHVMEPEARTFYNLEALWEA